MVEKRVGGGGGGGGGGAFGIATEAADGRSDGRGAYTPRGKQAGGGATYSLEFL
jgi:hypothetical protein